MEKNVILYVDDESINLELFQAIMGEEFPVLTAESAKEGLKILENNSKIAVLISDMKMPFMNGIEFITLAKKEYPFLKCFILTGYEITQEINDALNIGLIIEYYKKPFNNNEMIIEMRKALSVKTLEN